MKIYFAGGWFSPAQEEEHTRVGNFLKRHENLEVFNPRTAGGDFKVGKETDHMTQVLLNNCKSIDEADLVVAITDYKDMGTLWECGYAYAKQKPVIYYCETLGNKPFNLMLAKTGKVARDIDELENLLVDKDSYVFKQVHSFDGLVE